MLSMEEQLPKSKRCIRVSIRAGKAEKQKNKKKKKPSEKANLQEKADEYIKDRDRHKLLINRINRWTVQNVGRIEEIFKKIVMNESNNISYEEFYASLRDMDVPCSPLELVVLAKTIDPNHRGQLDYREFINGIRYESADNIARDQPVLQILRETFEKCPHCKIQRLAYHTNTNTRYINLTVLLSLITDSKTLQKQQRKEQKQHLHPFDIVELVHSHFSIEGIKEIIRRTFNYSVRDIEVYNFVKNSKVVLENTKTLEECGFNGGTEKHPEPVVLFYDIVDEVNSTPVLDCDHYFNR